MIEAPLKKEIFDYLDVYNVFSSLTEDMLINNLRRKFMVTEQEARNVIQDWFEERV